MYTINKSTKRSDMVMARYRRTHVRTRQQWHETRAEIWGGRGVPEGMPAKKKGTYLGFLDALREAGARLREPVGLLFQHGPP